MDCIDRLNPLLGNHLRDQVLRWVSNYLIVLIDHEEGTRVPGVGM